MKRLEVFHFSPRYEGRYREIGHEAQAEFTGQEVCYAGLEPGGAARFLSGTASGTSRRRAPTARRTSCRSAMRSTTAALYFVADEKPKRGPARALQRLVNLRENPRAALVVDDYDEDWTPARVAARPRPGARRARRRARTRARSGCCARATRSTSPCRSTTRRAKSRSSARAGAGHALARGGLTPRMRAPAPPCGAAYISLRGCL